MVQYQATDLYDAAWRHANYYHHKLSTLNADYAESPDVVMDTLRQQLPQIYHALDWLIRQAEAQETVAKLFLEFILNFKPALWMLILPSDFVDLLNKALEIATALKDRKACFEMYYHLGTSISNWGDFVAAAGYFEHAIEIGHELQDHLLLARAHHDLSICYRELNDTNKRQAAIEAANYHYQAINDQHGLSKVKSLMVTYAIDLGDYETALRVGKELIPIWRELGAQFQLAYQLYLLATAYVNTSRFDDALSTIIEARQVFRYVGEPRGEVACLQIISMVYYSKAMIDESLQATQELYEISHRIESQHGVIAALTHFGTLYTKIGNLEQAAEYYRQAIIACELVDLRYDLVTAQRMLGQIYLRQNQLQAARHHILTAYQTARSSSYDQAQFSALTSIVLLLVSEGELTLAAQINAYFEQEPNNISVVEYKQDLQDIFPNIILAPTAPPTLDNILAALLNHYHELS